MNKLTKNKILYTFKYKLVSAGNKLIQSNLVQFLNI